MKVIVVFNILVCILPRLVENLAQFFPYMSRFIFWVDYPFLAF